MHYCKILKKISQVKSFPIKPVLLSIFFHTCAEKNLKEKKDFIFYEESFAHLYGIESEIKKFLSEVVSMILNNF